jgi:hypothetical protein
MNGHKPGRRFNPNDASYAGAGSRALPARSRRSVLVIRAGSDSFQTSEMKIR